MTDRPSKTHIAADRLFMIALQKKDAPLLADELNHIQHCPRCMERFSSFIGHDSLNQLVGKYYAE